MKDLLFRPNFTHAFGGFPVDQARQYCADIAWCAACCRLTVLPVYGEEGMLSYKWSCVPGKTVRDRRPKIITQ